MSMKGSFLALLMCLFILQLVIRIIGPFNTKYFIYIIFSANYYKLYLLLTKHNYMSKSEINKSR